MLVAAASLLDSQRSTFPSVVIVGLASGEKIYFGTNTMKRGCLGSGNVGVGWWGGGPPWVHPEHSRLFFFHNFFQLGTQSPLLVFLVFFLFSEVRARGMVSRRTTEETVE